jgi:pimeloyl-ACP methyl ester carboxylesterase
MSVTPETAQMRARWFFTMAFSFLSSAARGDGPADNAPDKVRQVPPKGIVLATADRADLSSGLDKLSQEIADLRRNLKLRPDLLRLLPDVEIYESAVRTALKYDEFFNVREVPVAKGLLEQGMERARQLRDGKAPWNTATGLIVRGYVSKIDGSVQPYGLVVPASYQVNTPHRFRLDVWCHGRGETLSEVNFIRDRQLSKGEFTPPNAFVLHPYGRYCNANKFAGEIDLFEALEDVKGHYPIDEDRVVMRGFSMGGAACWQFAVHYPDIWVAAAPGAGFSETANFLRVFQNEAVQPSWYEQKLWHLYDCTDYALNLFNCPTVAYSGERDRQKQAADMMAKALEAEGIRLAHVIGAKAGHNYTADAKAEINRRIDRIASDGRDLVPRKVCFTTWTLRYNRSYWVQIDALEQHWERARIEAELLDFRGDGPQIKTTNISAFTLTFPAGRFLFHEALTKKPIVVIDGNRLEATKPQSDRSWTTHFEKVDGRWRVTESIETRGLRKRHGLQGPIDDAFLDSFMMVRPTGAMLGDHTGKWTNTEMNHAIEHWRTQFRGAARIKDDKDIAQTDIDAHNLILWGDPLSNAILAKIIDRLPLKWNKENVLIGEQRYDARHHMPVLIYPNPLNPKRYVVLNSGFTFREYDYLNNARQVPKLPDFAVIDVRVPVSPRLPGRVVTAGFFDENWSVAPVK